MPQTRRSCLPPTLVVSVVMACASARGASVPQEPVVEPSSATDLAVLLAEAEARQPRLRASAERIASAEATVPRMRALPDPEVRLSYTNEGVSGITFGDSPDAALTATWEQEIPYSGKRRLSGEVAVGQVQVARAELELGRRAVRAELITAYFEVVRIDRTAALLDESRIVLQSLLDSARVRYESGEGVLEDLLKAQTEIARLDAEQAELAQQRAETAARWNLALGRSAGTPVPPLSDPPELAIPEGQELLDAAGEGSASIQRLQRMEELGASRLALARRETKPDWIFGASWADRGSLDPMVMGMVGARLPLWRKNKQLQAVVEAERDLAAARADREAEFLETSERVQVLLAQLQRARRRIELLEQALIPQARSALDAGRASYSTGRTVFLSLLDDALDLLEFERDLERQRADLGTIAANLELNTGLRLVGRSAS